MVRLSFLVGVFSFIVLGVSFAEPKTDRLLKSDHFVINYHENVEYSYVSEVKDICEKYYRVITQEFRLVRDEAWLWANRAKIFIAKDKEEYSSKFRCPIWATACVNYQDKVIYTYPDQENFAAILIHELTHIIFREYVGLGKFPLWLDEAVSLYMEDKYSDDSRPRRDFTLIERAIAENSYIKLTDLNKVTALTLGSQPKDYVNLFYSEAFSIVYFIIKKYSQDNLYRLMYFLRRGYDCEDAVSKAVYSIRGWEDFETKWKRFYQE
ncbi:MAG: hypothetical protein ABIH71_03450 [Candidatus Omnitrophota bacterium]|nr:hypothetical protein [Candidatus Omnitrophota bacterium]